MATAHSNKILVGIIVVAISFYAYFPAVNGIGIWRDALIGSRVYDNSVQTGKANTLSFANPDDIANDIDFFVAWWSPGQYIVPKFIQSAFKCDLNRAQFITVMLASLLGLWGYYRLYKILNISAHLALLTLFFAVLNRNFFWYYIIYYGGETLLFPIVPWAVYFAIRNKELNWLQCALLVLISLLGFVFKQSYLIVFLAILLFLVLDKIQFDYTKSIAELKNSFKKIAENYSYFFRLTLLFTITGSVIYFTYLSKGETASSAIDRIGFNGIPNSCILDICYAPSTLITTFFRIGDGFFKIGKLLEFAHLPVGIVFIPLAILSIWLFLKIVKSTTISNQYKHLFTSFFIIFSLFFTWQYLKDAAISYEGRHYYALGYITAPAILLFLKEMFSVKIYKIAIGVLVCFSLFDGVRYYDRIQDFYARHARFDQYYLEKEKQPLLQLVKQLDEQYKTGNNLFVVDDWFYTVAINNNRHLCVQSYKNGFESYSGIDVNNKFVFKCLQGKVDRVIHVSSNNKFMDAERHVCTLFCDKVVFKRLKETHSYAIYIGIPK